MLIKVTEIAYFGMVGGRDVNFLKDQRNAELKAGGADVGAEIEMVPMTQIEMEAGADPRYSMSWWGPPGVPPPEIGRKIRYFESTSTGKQVVLTTHTHGISTCSKA